MNRSVFCVLTMVTLALGKAGAQPSYDYEMIDTPGAIQTFPAAINNDGDIVGYYQSPDRRFHAFLLRARTTQFMTIDPPNSTEALAIGINNNDQIVGTYYNVDSRAHGFLRNHGSYMTLDVPGALNSFANGINDPLSPGGIGQIVGVWQTIDTVQAGHAFLIDLSITSEFYRYDVPGSSATVFQAINNDGQIVGTTRIRTLRGFLLSDGSYNAFRVPGATHTFARGINDPPSPSPGVSGDIVGQYTDANGAHGYLLSGGQYTTLDAPFGTTSTELAGINNSGTIVGDYQAADGSYHGFRARPIRERLSDSAR